MDPERLVAENKRLRNELDAYTVSILQVWPAGGFACIVCQGWGPDRLTVQHKACAFDHVYQQERTDD